MNYIEEAENLLLYYNDLYRSVENLNREISKLIRYQTPSPLNAIQLEETGVRSSKVEDTYNMMFKLKTMVENKEKTELELKEIDRILEELSQDPGCEYYGQLLKEWYIYGTAKEKIADLIKSSSRNVYRIKDQAIKKFAVRYFGLDAMRVV
ncbi:hypothetical protein Desaci_1286 [Desulfosporosinus acidiphilus SJ4]|uniref:Phage transcriptional regulator, RinA family n=1 Tax=Desulfosporosinus acidiphilus (strain DSM 22704 / JCM 16185 / SJ4) TaxID=646529 RepID=I4D3D8_DESAJ|nr:hypothetical protein [Desulfosporosinus acidiphilus]AFM40312.1 hypothetical protein Desaci_1286 [Desulfosporosinus acidiphilus SJ4]